jgi:hypothetical protein
VASKLSGTTRWPRLREVKRLPPKGSVSCHAAQTAEPVSLPTTYGVTLELSDPGNRGILLGGGVLSSYNGYISSKSTLLGFFCPKRLPPITDSRRDALSEFRKKPRD